MGAALRLQPQFPVTLNRSSKFAAKALAIVSAAYDVNLATGKPLTATGSGYLKSGTLGGRSWSFRKNFYVETEILPAVGTASFVEFWYGVISSDQYTRGNGTSDPNNGPGMLTGDKNNQFGIAAQVGNNTGAPSPDNWGCIYNWANGNPDGNGSNLAHADETLPVTGRPVMLLEFRKQDRVEFWRDGRLVKTLPWAAVNKDVSTLICGAFVENTAYWSSSSDTILAGRVLTPNEPSAAEIQAFMANPWGELFNAPNRQARVASYAGGAGSGTATTIAANTGYPIYSGQSALVSATNNIATGYGSNAVTGRAASVSAASTVTSSPSLSTQTGQPSSIVATSNIAASSGVNSIQGQAASVGGVSTIIANPAVVVSYGSPAAVSATTNLFSNYGLSSSAGQPATIIAPSVIVAGSGAMVAGGQPATTSGATTVQASTGVVSSAGQSASVGGITTVSASVAQVVSTGSAASISTPATVNASPAVVMASGQVASIILPASVSAAAARVVNLGQSAQVSTPVVIGAALGFGVGTGQGATIATVPSINAVTAFGVTAGQAATVQTFAPLQALPAIGVSTGQAASVVGAANVAVNITEDRLCQIVRAYIQSVAPMLRVIRTPVNLASPPNGSYVSFTPGLRSPLSTTSAGYVGLTRAVMRHEEMRFQIDCYGAGARDLSETLSALFRDQYALDQFAQFGQDVVPLYASDVTQMPFVNDSNQYEERYMFEIHIQVNSTIITPQQSATMLNINILSIDATFPPA